MWIFTQVWHREFLHVKKCYNTSAFSTWLWHVFHFRLRRLATGEVVQLYSCLGHGVILPWTWGEVGEVSDFGQIGQPQLKNGTHGLFLLTHIAHSSNVQSSACSGVVLLCACACVCVCVRVFLGRFARVIELWVFLFAVTNSWGGAVGVRGVQLNCYKNSPG